MAQRRKEAELADLYVKTNPPPQINPNMSAGEVAQREALKSDLIRRFERHPDGMADYYKDLLARGGGVAADLVEELAPDYLGLQHQAARAEILALAEERRMSRMSPEQLQLHQRAGELVERETNLEAGWQHAKMNLSDYLSNVTEPRDYPTRDDRIGEGKLDDPAASGGRKGGKR